MTDLTLAICVYNAEKYLKKIVIVTDYEKFGYKKSRIQCCCPNY